MKKLWYFVKWKGCPEDENTWKPHEGMRKAQEEVESLHRENQRCQAPERSHHIERCSIGRQANTCGFTLTVWSLRRKLDCIIEIEFSERTLRRGQLVLGAQTPCKDFWDRVTLP